MRTMSPELAAWLRSRTDNSVTAKRLHGDVSGRRFWRVSSGGETLLSIDVAYPIVVGQLLLLENRDHPHREVHQVMYVIDDNLILKTRLSTDFLRGSRLYQLDGSITR